MLLFIKCIVSLLKYVKNKDSTILDEWPILLHTATRTQIALSFVSAFVLVCSSLVFG